MIDWLMVAVGGGAVGILWVLSKNLEILVKLQNQHLSRISAIQERLERVNDTLLEIERHTRRAVREAYEDDDWHNHQPPS